MEEARAAYDAGSSGLGELHSRRRGLYVTLGLIALVLIGLAIRIRSLGG